MEEIKLIITSAVGILSLCLNVLIVLLQAKTSAAMAELKVYMHENFIKKGINNG